MTDQRARIRECITTNPGIHFNGLTRKLDLAPGQVQYHLKQLLRSDRINQKQLYGRTHYYLPETGEWERGALALLRRETARDILFYLLEHGSSKPTTVADALDIARSTLEWHLDRLTECDLVEKHYDSQNHVTLILARPEETAKLVHEVSPSLPERMTDRFIRLVDNLLSE